MAFTGVNYVAVVVAAVAGFAFGALWYMALSRQWLAAVGKTETALRSERSIEPFVIAAVAQLVMAFMLAGLIGHFGPGKATVANGLITGASLWFGFVLTTVAVNYAFQGAKRALTMIDSLHWLGVLLVQGLVIGLFGA